MLMPPLEAYFISSTPAQHCPPGKLFQDHRVDKPQEYFLIFTWREMHRAPSRIVSRKMDAAVHSCITDMANWFSKAIFFKFCKGLMH